MNKYQQGKEQARRTAQELQIYCYCISWGELAERGEHLQKLAKRYGLIKEFHNEGII